MIGVGGNTELSSTARRIFSLALLILGAVILYQSFYGDQRKPENLDVSELRAKIQRNEITRLTVTQTEVLAVDVTGGQWRADLSNAQQRGSLLDAATQLDASGHPYVTKVEDISSKGGILQGVLLKWTPFVVSVALGVFLGGVLLRKVFPTGR